MPGPTGMGPNKLANPTPQDDGIDAIIQAMESMPQAQPQQGGFINQAMDTVTDATSSVADGIDSIIAAMDAPEQNLAVEPDILPEDQIQPRDASLMEQIEEAPARFKLSFARTDLERKQTLEKIYGAENVRKTKDGLAWRKGKDDKWKKLDSGDFELINDIVDFARDTYEQAYATVGTAGGIALAAPQAATVAGIPTAGLTVAAGRGAGAVAGTYAADKFAENVLGIERDPERSRAVEMTLSAVLNAGFGAIGDKIGGVKHGAKVVDKAVENAVAWENGVKNQADDMIKTVNRLQEKQIVQAPNGEQIIATPDMLAANSPELKQIGIDLTTDNRIRAFKEALGQKLVDGYKKIASQIGNTTSSKLNLGKRFEQAVGTVEEAEGKLIGTFREAAVTASNKAGGPVQKMSNASSTVETIISDLQKQVIGNKTVTNQLTPELVADKLGGIPIAKAKALVNNLAELTEKLRRGGLTMEEIQMQTKKLTSYINNLKPQTDNPHPELANLYITLKNAIKQDEYAAIDGLLGDSAKTGYQRALQRFSSVKNSVDELNKIIGKSNVSKEAFAKQLFSGANAADQIKQVKNIIGGNSPLWKDLVGARMMDLLETHTIREAGPKAGNVNWQGLIGEVEKMGIEARYQMFGGKDPVLLFKDFSKLASRFQAKDAEYVARNPSGVITAFRNLWLGFGTAKGEAIGNLVGMIGKDKAVAKWLAKDGIAEIAKTFPKRERGRVATFLQNVADEASKIRTPIKYTVKGAARSKAVESMSPGTDLNQLE